MPKMTDKRYLNPVVIDEVLTRRVAALAVAGGTVPSIMRELKLSRDFIEEIQNSTKFKEIVTEIGEEETGAVIAKGKAELQKSVRTAVKVIQKAMEGALDGTVSMREGLQASQIVLKAAGLQEEGEKSQETQIVVQLPRGIEPITYEVNSATDPDAVGSPDER
jgi:hypothetical protein